VASGNALTTPAQRHLVRVPRGGSSPALLTAVQQGGASGRTLGLFRSTDGGQTWRHEGGLAGASSTDRADLLVVGDRVASLVSVETPDGHGVGGSTERDVTFQWWGYASGEDRFRPGRQVTVFDSRSDSTAYYRAQLARDSKGRLWAQAFKRESDGTSTLVLAVSTDGGGSWQQQEPLARGIKPRAGGRLIASGGRLLMVWGTHGCCDAGRYRVRSDGASIGSWSSTQTFAPEGLYHGAALSAVADGAGGVHLVYKDLGENLRYRRFGGSGWGGAVTLEGNGDWALQPATTRVGDTLVVFYNRPWSNGDGYDLVVKRVRDGRVVGSAGLGSVRGFAGYPAGVDVMPSGTTLPFLLGTEPSGGGNRVLAYRTSGVSSSDVEERSAMAAGAAADDGPVDDVQGEAVGGSGEAGVGAGGEAGVEVADLTGPTEAEGGCGGGAGGGSALALGAGVLAVRWRGGRRRREPRAGQ
jgi:hypothetical protein